MHFFYLEPLKFYYFWIKCTVPVLVGKFITLFIIQNLVVLEC